MAKSENRSLINENNGFVETLLSDENPLVFQE